MKKDQFYQAALIIFKEQGHKEAYAFLIRRGYKTKAALEFMNELAREDDSKFEEAVERATTISDNSGYSIQRENGVFEKPAGGFIHKLFGI